MLIDSIQNLKDKEFVKDDLIRHLLVFAHNSLLNHQNNLFKEGHLLQVDKVNIRRNEKLLFLFSIKLIFSQAALLHSLLIRPKIALSLTAVRHPATKPFCWQILLKIMGKQLVNP